MVLIGSNLEGPTDLVARRQIGKQIFSGTSFLVLIVFDKALREKDDSPKTNGCAQAGILDTKWIHKFRDLNGWEKAILNSKLKRIKSRLILMNKVRLQ